MEGAQVKFGIRFVLLVLVAVFIGVPAVKVAAGKMSFLPEGAKNWINLA